MSHKSTDSLIHENTDTCGMVVSDSKRENRSQYFQRSGNDLAGKNYKSCGKFKIWNLSKKGQQTFRVLAAVWRPLMIEILQGGLKLIKKSLEEAGEQDRTKL